MIGGRERKDDVLKRIETAIGGPLRHAGQDYLMPDGRRVLICYSKPHHNERDFYLGLPNRLQSNDALVLLLGNRDLVFPSAETLLRYRDSYPRSSNGRPIPSLQKRSGHFVLRVAKLGLTIILDDRVDAYGELANIPGYIEEISAGFGQPFHKANELFVSGIRDPFTVDPDMIDRGTRGHARTLNALAAYLETLAIRPLEARADDPPFDLGWVVDGRTFVAEIKSLTKDNEERQLRLGLGQVLRYRHLLRKRATNAVAALVTELEPSDPEWKTLCDSLGIRLAFPPGFVGLLNSDQTV